MENNLIKGVGILYAPGEIEGIEVELEFKGNNSDIIPIIKILTGDESGEISCVGLLPAPLNSFAGFVVYDQISQEYNFGLCGRPIFGKLLIMKVDTSDEDGRIIPITTEEDKEVVKTFLNAYKKYELDAKIYEAISSDTKTIEDRMNFMNRFFEDENTSISDIASDKEVENKMKENNNTTKIEEEIKINEV